MSGLLPWFAYGRHRKGWLRVSWAKDRLKDDKDGFDRPEGEREHFDYSLEGAGLTERYLEGKAALHVHLIGLPHAGERDLEPRRSDYCALFQRRVGRSVAEHLKFLGTNLIEAKGSLENVDGGPGDVRNPMLVSVVECGESVERLRDRAKDGVVPGFFRGAPDRHVAVIEGLQFLDACQVATEARLLGKLAGLRPEVLDGSGECRIPVRVVGIGGVDRKTDHGYLGRLSAGNECPQADHEVVKSGPGVVDAVTDHQAPVGVEGLQVADVERVLASISVDVAGDAVVVSVLKRLYLGAQDVQVVPGPSELLVGVSEVNHALPLEEAYAGEEEAVSGEDAGRP